MNVEIITPNGTLFKGQATTVSVPSLQGPFTMLEHHAPIVAILERGIVRLIDAQGEEKMFDIDGGFCEQHDGAVIICAETKNRT